MKLLQDILYKVEIHEVAGSTNLAIHTICFDSRKVTKDSLFVATRGSLVDGHDYISQAIESGAVVIVAEELPMSKPDNVTFVKVKNSQEALGVIAANYFDNPSDELKLIAVTGTNGKTSVASLLFDMYQSIGKKAGLLSTIVNKIGFKEIPSTHTTPDAISLNSLLSQMVEDGCQFCFIEASSHAIHQKRIFGLNFAGAIFTNISHDHLDYHKTFDDYILAKKALFDYLPSDAFALVNKDDRHGMNMLHHCNAKTHTYALKSMADFKARILENQFDGLLLNIDGREVWSKLVGEFNAYNLLAIYATAVLLGEDDLQALTYISTLNSPEGRFETITSETGITGIVDYAHTPDALKNVLSTIQSIKREGQQLISIIGCGGDRDKSKRPIMSKIAVELSDKVILTSDNPRSEDPASILKDMQAGLDSSQLSKVLTISDREEAIKTACSLATDKDVILIAGKGHEKYQEIQGLKHDFDDKEKLINALNLLKK
jgi:UDP-N-acetylmuramoyl-L-alanyl-D-glutamate--2,6-diaminopimelate ligase